jgi:hypothetical protein
MPQDYPVNSPFANWHWGEKDGLFDEKGNPQLRGMGNNMIPLSVVHMSQREKIFLNEKEYTDEEIIELLQLKILERGTSSKDLLKRSYFLFGTAGGGISQQRFRSVLQKFGMVLSEARVAKLFRRFDSDGVSSCIIHTCSILLSATNCRERWLLLHLLIRGFPVVCCFMYD